MLMMHLLKIVDSYQVSTMLCESLSSYRKLRQALESVPGLSLFMRADSSSIRLS